MLGSGRNQSKRGEASSHRRSIAVRRDIKLSFKHHGSFKEYLIDVWSVWWFYLVIIVALSEFFFVIYDLQTGPLLFFRIVFGLGVLGLIPGFLTVQAVFPGDKVNTLEKIALGIFLSVLISITIGVVLGIGPLFQASNNIILLTGYVILVDVAASYRRYSFVKKSR
ncbi:DUF1616 domain-containing protein [Candidatus Bathyarchaeota archaeon]|nr:MAG: DUF1616 domain-containing protein [Candidatus Bathyarchaeota archaeon]